MSEALPIIFLTARDSDMDTVSGLRIGADDYLTKDISFPHLLARIAALFRRQDAMGEPVTGEAMLQQGFLSMDTQRMVTQWKDKNVDLTVTEFWMVHALAKYMGHVKNRQQLMQESQMVVDDSTITSHIKRIRKKFIQIDSEFDCIDTVYGMGYRWNTNSS
jgi:two-component system OmpR family response regulator